MQHCSEKQHIEAAIKFGLDAIVFTDHNRSVPQENKDRTYYHEITDNWEGEFDRVAMEKSYAI